MYKIMSLFSLSSYIFVYVALMKFLYSVLLNPAFPPFGYYDVILHNLVIFRNIYNIIGELSVIECRRRKTGGRIRYMDKNKEQDMEHIL